MLQMRQPFNEHGILSNPGEAAYNEDICIGITARHCTAMQFPRPERVSSRHLFSHQCTLIPLYGRPLHLLRRSAKSEFLEILTGRGSLSSDLHTILLITTRVDRLFPSEIASFWT